MCKVQENLKKLKEVWRKYAVIVGNILKFYVIFIEILKTFGRIENVEELQRDLWLVYSYFEN